MKMMLEFVLGFVIVGLAAAQQDLDVNEDVLVVNVPRFKGNLPDCKRNQVCADVFNFTRNHGDGTGRLESRVIQNCKCPIVPCGMNDDPLMFKETKTQSMMTCEEASQFKTCSEDDIAKVQIFSDHTFFLIRCLCPNNENPQGFFKKMTVPARNLEGPTPEEQEMSDAFPPRPPRYYRCRDSARFGF